MNVGLYDRRVHAKFLAIFQTQIHCRLHDQLIDGLQRLRSQPVKGTVESTVLRHRLAVEIRELPQRVPSAIRSRSSRKSQFLTRLRIRERRTCCGVNPLRPVPGFFRPCSRSRRTASIISSWSSRKWEMLCSTGSSKTPCCSNSQSAKLICGLAVLGTVQFSAFFEAWSRCRFKALT